MAKYGKKRGHHCWWLTIDGNSVANFDNETDVDGIIDTEVERNNLKAASSQAMEYVSMIPQHTENAHALHYVESAKAWLSKGQENNIVNMSESEKQRYRNALKGLKGQAEAVTEALPDKPDSKAMSNSQSLMSEHSDEVKVIYRLVMKKHIPVPELTEKQLFEWLSDPRELLS